MGTMADINDWLPKMNGAVKCGQLLGRHFAVVPCDDYHFSLVRRKLDGVFGVEEWHGTAGESQEDFLVLYVTDDKALTLAPALEDLGRRYGLTCIYGEPGSISCVGAQNTAPQPWAGLPTELGALYASIKGYPEFTLRGSYDTSLSARMSENARKGKLIR